MRRSSFLLAIPIALLADSNAAGDTYPRQAGIDAVHYVFKLTLTDASNEIAGESTATFRFTSPGLKEVAVDLASAANGKGMTVSAVACAGKPVQFTHDKDRLRIALTTTPSAGDEISCTTSYRGTPAGGLRIIDNIYGERTAFSENWPNNARHWLPMIDHPYDKATGEFVVTAPSQYQVIANGLLVEETDLEKGVRRTHWKQSAPIASWLYAIGMARFTAKHYATSKGVPQQTWVFPQDAEKGQRIFEGTGRRAFEYFSEQIGPYA
jgi:aminopeptidase N